MDHQRNKKTNKYYQKKAQQEKHSNSQKLGFTQQEGNLIQVINQMDAEDLYKFMENKYQKMIASNEKLFPKIFSAAKKRMTKFIEQFQQNEKVRFINFVKKHTGYTPTAQDVKQIFEPKQFSPFKLTNNQLISVGYSWSKANVQPRIHMIKVSIFQPKQQFSHLKKKYYLGGLKQDYFEEVDIKRFKKQCNQSLSLFLEHMKIVDNLLNQQEP